MGDASHLTDGGDFGGNALKSLLCSLCMAHIAELDVALVGVVWRGQDAVHLPILRLEHPANVLIAQVWVVICECHHACSNSTKCFTAAHAIISYEICLIVRDQTWWEIQLLDTFLKLLGLLVGCKLDPTLPAMDDLPVHVDLCKLCCNDVPVADHQPALLFAGCVQGAQISILLHEHSPCLLHVASEMRAMCGHWQAQNKLIRVMICKT